MFQPGQGLLYEIIEDQKTGDRERKKVFLHPCEYLSPKGEKSSVVRFRDGKTRTVLNRKLKEVATTH